MPAKPLTPEDIDRIRAKDIVYTFITMSVPNHGLQPDQKTGGKSPADNKENRQCST